jgi:mRNA interferase RelE/StbE
LLIKPTAVKDIEAIPLKRDRQRVVERISKLAEDPRPSGSEKISGQDKYRVRQGRYRILYVIEAQDLLVQVVKIGHRKDIYR